MTATTWTGGCQCRHIRYHLADRPLTVYACHCAHCQKQAASAFGLSVWARAADFVLEQGDLRFWETRGDSGRVKRCGFCPRCGSRVHHCSRTGEDEAIYSLKGGTLDNARDLRPVAHIWTRSAQRWLDLENSGLPMFATEPESFDQLVIWFSEQQPED